MDDVVMRAMRRWPDVPNAYGWLALDRRGHWLLKGERIGNRGLVEFIDRNYASDAAGRWFFQNGPQRVFVDLACAPFVYRSDGGRWVTHTGLAAAGVQRAFAAGDALLLLTEQGLGSISDRDLPEAMESLADAAGARLTDDAIAAWLEGAPVDARFVCGDDRVPVELTTLTALMAAFRVDPAPRPRAGEPEC